MDVQIHTPTIKLDQLLKLCGIAESGGRAKEMIQEGFVQVNGVTCLERGKKLKNGDQIQFENKSVTVKGELCEDNKA